ncbi:MAG: hypothetical protein QOH16_2952 [Gaiellaceae bacterium]|nr:hypothetical protein [Gaiellaceae bacterium]
MPAFRRPSVRTLWIVAALAAAAVTGISLIPHGTPRGAVARYIQQANETGVAFAKQYQGVSSAYRSLSLAKGPQAAQTARLKLAARRLTALRIQLEQLPAPAQAHRLRLRLIAFYRQQEQVAQELAGIMAYFPQVIAAERGIKPGATQMHKALAKARAPAAQAAVLGTYAGTLATARDRVQAVRPPALLAQAQRAEVARLARTARAIRAVQRGLLAHNRVQLQKALTGLQDATSVTSTATRVAILAYNRHIADIQRLGAKVELERRRLDASL